MPVIRGGEKDVNQVEEQYRIQARIAGPHQGVKLIVLVSDNLQQGGGSVLLEECSESEQMGEDDGEGRNGRGGEGRVLHQLKQQLVVGH